MVPIVVIAVVLLVLAIAALMDRRARADGHQLRGAGGWRGIRETRRDLRAGDATGFLNKDSSWTAASKRNADAKAQKRREDQH